jgi:GxxExxY protein
MKSQKTLNTLTYQVIGAAIEVYKIMGRGLLESVYHQCMKEELSYRKINFLTEFKIPVIYKGRELNIDFRCDLLVEECLLVELKATNESHPVFEAQLITYMKLLRVPKGILINFNCSNIFNEGQKTFINEYFDQLPLK